MQRRYDCCWASKCMVRRCKRENDDQLTMRLVTCCVIMMVEQRHMSCVECVLLGSKHCEDIQKSFAIYTRRPVAVKQRNAARRLACNTPSGGDALEECVSVLCPNARTNTFHFSASNASKADVCPPNHHNSPFGTAAKMWHS